MQSLAAGIGLMAQSLSMSTSDQAIWPHSPKSLLPLLERYLPYSLSVQSLVAGTQYAEPDQPISTRPSPVLSDDDCISHVWCTFPPSAIDDPPIPFHIMAIVPRPQENTTRSFCSAEAVPHTAGDESTTAKLVTDSFKTLHELYPFVTLAGGVHERWVKPMLKAFDAEERILTWMWLSPKGGSAALTLDETATQARLQKDGLMLDVGREGDAQIICDTRGARSPLSYYHKQLPHTTVLRPVSAPGEPVQQAVCWIMTHAAGDQGVLYTIPEWRRKGLAKIVTYFRLKESAKSGVRGFVWVFAGNQASNDMWKGLGWEKQWTAQWIYLKDDPTDTYGKKSA